MFRRKKFRLRLASRTLTLGARTFIMGVLNVTPDSFSDGGLYFDTEAAIARAVEIERAGADIVDIGGESARPGSTPITAEQELKRVLPVLEGLRGRVKIPISIDTQKAAVAEAAVALGAEMLNDVSALRTDAALAAVARRHRLPIILMHMRGTPRTMQKGPFARDVLRDVTSGLRAAVARARKAGLSRAQLILDPGIGFGKSFAQNYELLARLPELARLFCPLLVGASRKTFIGATLARPRGALVSDRKPESILPPDERIWGTAATVGASILGGAHIVRVHDVAEMVQVARITDAILQAC
jgi:dihydropteroate synthase